MRYNLLPLSQGAIVDYRAFHDLLMSVETAVNLWVMSYLHQEGTQQRQPKNANQSRSGMSKVIR